MTTSQNRKKKKAENTNRIWLWIAAGVIIVILAVIFLIPGTQKGTGKMAAEINVAEVAKLRDQGAFILDVREQSEWDELHIPGATLIPLGTLPNELTKIPKDKTVVVVCRTGRRSAQGRDILLNAGFENVTSMAGGVTEWKASGYPIETGK
ncbi:rhodanese-like domain-containing protein [Leptolinea tardivitalis]|nr:rhodanese-like domain-containing protein [Leptolinea tardivitalis]GAP20486.1 rhodanese-related sulfurtransferase [Leptolinea tardivitalis]